MVTAADTLAYETRRLYRATPAQVFAAWTEAESLGAWFAPTADMTTTVHHLDARTGGGYRIEMRAAGGRRYIARGTYTEFAAPHRLSFTWNWEDGDGEESLVEIQLREAEGGCELLLRHSRFATAGSRDGHAQGWNASLERLSTIFTTN